MAFSSDPDSSCRLARMDIAVNDELTQIYRDILKTHVPSKDILSRVQSCGHFQRNKLHDKQIKKLKTAQSSGYKELDITLMYSLLRNLCPNLTPPTNGWGIQQLPDSSEITIGDDIERIRIIRNEIRHKYSAGMSESDFTKWWNEVYNICHRQQNPLSKQYVVNLRSIECMTFDDKRLRSLEHFRLENKTEEGLYVKTLKVSPESNEEDTKVKSLSGCCAETLKEMVKHINQKTSRQDISMLYETFKSYLDTGKPIQKNSSAFNILNRIKSKIHWYAELNPSRAIKILAEFAKFTCYLAREYEVQQEYHSGSIIITLVFCEENTLKKFGLDFKTGKIQELLETLLCSETLLSIFEISPESFRIRVEDITENTEKEDLDMRPFLYARNEIRCDLCETSKKRMYYCHVCQVNLCRPCIGEHINNYERHQIVPFQQTKSTLIYPKCATHPTKACELQCQECDIPICALCSESESHKTHTLSKLFEIYHSKRKIIEKDLDKLENIISPKYKEIATDTETQIASLDRKYGKLIAEVKYRGEEWHKEIHNIVKELTREITEIKIKHQDILKKHLDEIKQIQLLIEQTLFSLKKIEETIVVSRSLEYRSKNKEFSKLPPKVQVSIPTISPQILDKEQLKTLFGFPITLSIKIEENGYKLKRPETLTGELLEDPELITTFDTRFNNLRSVTCLSEEEIWTCGYDDSEMKCFNIQDSLIETIKTKSGVSPNGIAVTGDGNLVYSDWRTRTVNEVKNGQIEEMIRLQGWRPRNLCVTSSDELLVTMYSDDESQSKVVRYSGSTEEQTIQFDEEGKPLYSGNDLIKYISENRNLDICIADCGAYAVVVVNHIGQLRFRYTGNPSLSKNKQFIPYGITTDSQSQIIITDCDNHCIHILDENGQFLRYIENCGLRDPVCLCVDKNNCLFVAEWRGNVKKIEYLG